ncbi:hypothetical protein XYCOK13_24270 [Xylanibacillus composti]|uniref:Uncharacterized protein n=1 Tax=Xylanibacillus composti TaxID=1572762 RepID=A0A8J4H6W6_9BACL|nr:hypothetical protein [Xylanibacillus composti]GIQ69603.1 hypothetical protein XYCOK13_24270 [Xylanibacillus composti]
MHDKQLDGFLGEWTLVPHLCSYEVGQPPKQGLYRIEWSNDLLVCSLSWVSTDNTKHQTTYLTKPDGVARPYTTSDLADTILTRLSDDHTLDTAVMKADIVVSFARRILAENQTQMTITQSGFTPEGKGFANHSVYHRQRPLSGC